MESVRIRSDLHCTAINGNIALPTGGIGILGLKGIPRSRGCRNLQVIVIRCSIIANGNAVIASNGIVFC